LGEDVYFRSREGQEIHTEKRNRVGGKTEQGELIEELERKGDLMIIHVQA
jgi:hypothetical protein